MDYLFSINGLLEELNILEILIKNLISVVYPLEKYYKLFGMVCLRNNNININIIGEPIFVRRITKSEVEHENTLPRSTLLDPENEVVLTPSGNTQILVCSAACTHLGCIPVPYLGAYKGWVCLCHGSVYDKYGRVRQGNNIYLNKQ